MQAKKKISNLVCAQLESKQYQEVNFLPLIRCCVVIDQIAQLCVMTNSGYRWYHTCAPGLDHHENSLSKALGQPQSAMLLNHNHNPEALAARHSTVPTKVSPECR